MVITDGNFYACLMASNRFFSHSGSILLVIKNAIQTLITIWVDFAQVKCTNYSYISVFLEEASTNQTA